MADIPVTAVGYSIVSPKTLRLRRYRKLCSAAAMIPTEEGWGFLRCHDRGGQKVTLITDDVEYMELLIAGRKAGVLAELEVPFDTFPISRAGWPEDW